MEDPTVEESTRKSLLIPVHKSDEIVELFTDEFPDDANDIMDILRAEIAPLEVWLSVAIEYYLQGRTDQFEVILDQATMPEAEEIYNDDAARKSRLKMFNAWVSHYVNVMWNEDDERRREIPAQKAVALFQKADRIDAQCPNTLVGKALMFMAKGEDERAERFLKNVLIADKENLPAILASALLHVRKKKFVEAKKLYQEAIVLHPKSPQASRIRMCFAYCCYQMGCVDKAKAVMKYAAALDDSNVTVMMANALWSLASLPADDRLRSMQDEGSRFMALVHHAHALDPKHPSVLNHLANHYFLQWIPLPGTVSVVRGSAIATTTHDISNDVVHGQLICIGDKYIAYVQDVSSRSITLDVPFKEVSRSGLSISRKLYDQMNTLASNAYHATQVKELRAESCYLIARGHHAEGKYQEAFGYYYNAARSMPSYAMPWYGLAQMYYHQNVLEKAVVYLEKTLKLFPDNTDVLLFLGHVYRRLGRKADAIANFRRVADLDPGNVDALIGTAEILHVSTERHEQLAAISAYVAAQRVLQNAMEPVPDGLHTNFGSLHMRVGQIHEAIECYGLALNQKTTIAAIFEVPAVTEANVTVLYNLALAYEKLGEWRASTGIYKAILETFPWYLDALLRLAVLERDVGNADKATTLLDQALAQDPTCATACLLQANMHFAKREWSLAQKKYEAVLGMKQPDGGMAMKNDPYTFLSMGNIFMSNIGEKGRYVKNMTLSETYYKKTLSGHAQNVYAANGIGIMLAEKGQFDKAKLVFAQVREAAPDMPDAWINLGHIHMAEHRFGEAIQLYQVSLAKHYKGQDVSVLLYLAKAYYEAKRYSECITALTKGIHMAPQELKLWYNLALAQEDFAVATLGETSASVAKSSRTMADVQRAISDLQRAQRIYAFLDVAVPAETSSKKAHQIEMDKVRDHAKFCHETLEKASVHLEFERQREEKRKADAENRRRMVMMLEDEQQAQLVAQKEREAALELKRAQMLKATQERLKAASEAWKQKEADTASKTAKKSSKKRKADVSDDEDDEDDVVGAIPDAAAAASSPPPAKKPKATDDLFGSESEHEDDERETIHGTNVSPPREMDDKQHAELFGSDSDDD
ncbi:hypothetical protein H257_08339 [Aphanomyces astaci]|uniref:RNA polymerase-associated protein CTR9 n=1 Tax=Aphanomyces astaci TaxID=112090 RepID=W4GEQ1_APHAT|nr:hypothetical protein H257_08339 [Aphanomyces astaci]ETV78135.1 hypothetical protein H257_08339 [Aphanomyces astaci]|eukprot:XP_009832472.1 hypothetical protein H257_08339 [Aphanomyces astaci]